MATAKPTPDPFDPVRDAFAGLGTSEKAAFVLEATFETLSQALAETGRRAASVLDDLDIDSWFDTRGAWDMGAPPSTAADPPASTPEPKAAAPKKRTAAPKKKPAAPKKTAGKPTRRRPSADDDAA